MLAKRPLNGRLPAGFRHVWASGAGVRCPARVDDTLTGRTVATPRLVCPEPGSVQAFHHLETADSFDVDL